MARISIWQLVASEGSYTDVISKACPAIGCTTGGFFHRRHCIARAGLYIVTSVKNPSRHLTVQDR